MTIVRIETDDQILSTRHVMLQLRPHIPAGDYLETVRRLMQTDRYALAAALDDAGVVRAVAGYRLMNMLYCGHILSIDDLITDDTARSGGYGKQLLDWLKDEARTNGCKEVHLDSRVIREQAHRFYFRERFGITAFHFVATVG